MDTRIYEIQSPYGEKTAWGMLCCVCCPGRTDKVNMTDSSTRQYVLCTHYRVQYTGKVYFVATEAMWDFSAFFRSFSWPARTTPASESHRDLPMRYLSKFPMHLFFLSFRPPTAPELSELVTRRPLGCSNSQNPGSDPSINLRTGPLTATGQSVLSQLAFTPVGRHGILPFDVCRPYTVLCS